MRLYVKLQQRADIVTEPVAERTIAGHAGWRRFRALNQAERWLVMEAAGVLSVARIGLVILLFPTLRRVLDGYARPSRAPVASSAPLSPSLVGWAIAAVGRRLPGGATCLPKALAGHTILRRLGFQSELKIGVVARDPTGTIKAHAWVLREVALPRPTYMLEAYGLSDSILHAALLPLRYFHRGVRGVWKVMRGQK